ncbi:hypothetical protein DFH09DRAFT_1493303 [Mycena vulgaris]|nr:hypothetical protein DFH09DRAFT_1493303 [Mycena vulgaris]
MYIFSTNPCGRDHGRPWFSWVYNAKTRKTCVLETRQPKCRVAADCGGKSTGTEERPGPVVGRSFKNCCVAEFRRFHAFSRIFTRFTRFWVLYGATMEMPKDVYGKKSLPCAKTQNLLCHANFVVKARVEYTFITSRNLSIAMLCHMSTSMSTLTLHPAPRLQHLADMTRCILLNDERVLGELLRAPIIVDSATGQSVDFILRAEEANELVRLDDIPPQFHDILVGNSGVEPSIPDYIRISFPSLKITPERYIATSKDPATGNYDFTAITVHYSINSAFTSASDPDDLFDFLGFAIIIHGLGHAFRALGASEMIPGYAHPPTHHGHFFSERRVFSALAFPEAGFAAEIGIFGGIIGAAFDDEVNGALPPFLDLDYCKIKFLCLSRQEGPEFVTYRINPKSIRERLHALLCPPLSGPTLIQPFGPTDLFEISPPLSDVVDRSAALLNSTHLPRSDAAELAANNPCYKSVLIPTPPSRSRPFYPNLERRNQGPPLSPQLQLQVNRGKRREEEIGLQMTLYRTFRRALPYRPPPLVHEEDL